MKSTILYFTLFFIFYQAQAQIRELAADQEAGKGNLSQMEWLTGYWTGEGFGGECEEVWMPLVDSHIIGTFRFWSEGKLIFSEFMNLVQEGDTFSLKLKHFNPDLTGWEANEEWTTFRLIEVGENAVWFDGLTMIRIGDEIKLHLAITENGKQIIEELSYRKGVL
jgi:hypothetical protein